MGYRIELDEARCIGCGACSVACMDQNDLDVPLRRCVAEETGEGAALRMSWRSVSCLHCADAPCMAACPQGCIYRDGDTGFVLCDSGRCVGCRRCEAACPVGAPVFDGAGKMHKCDGCAARVRDGREPACVRVCPMGALRLQREE